jgi:hypothetical protein
VYWEMRGDLGTKLGGLRKTGGKSAFAEASADWPASNQASACRRAMAGGAWD